MAVAPRVSVIVIGHDPCPDLHRCVEALTKCRYPNVEIIVVLGGPRGEPAELAASLRDVQLIDSHSDTGTAAAANRGLARASGDYVALVQGDTVVEQRWIVDLVGFLDAHPDTAAAGGKIFAWDEQNPPGSRTGPYHGCSRVDPNTCCVHPAVDEPEQLREVTTLSGAAVMIRRAAIEQLRAPFLEPAFRCGYAEADFFARAMRNGWRLHYLSGPAAWRRSAEPSSPGAGSRLAEREQGRLLYAYRHLPAPLLRNLLRASARAALAELARQPLGRAGHDGRPRARRDALRWALANRQLLTQQRQAALTDGLPYDLVVQATEARARYYDFVRPEVLALVPEKARYVVDVGCASGALGKALKKQRPSVEVRGIEPVAEQADRARAVLDDVLLGRAQDPVPAHWPRADCVVFADVLEHLDDPWEVLRHWRQQLAPGGSLVVSLPNVAHRSVVGSLLRGRWEYQDAGILDRTHLRFFTRKTAVELLEQAGFHPVHFERVISPPPRGPAGRLLTKWARSVGDCGGASARVADLLTVQFLFVAR